MEINKAVIIGRCGRPHGVKGWIRIYSYTEPENKILTYTPWLVKENNNYNHLDIEQYKTGHQHILVKFQGYQDRTQIKQLTNVYIYTWRDQFEVLPEGEHYWVDLEGMRVVNTQQEELGYVDHLFATGANDVMVVRHETNQLLIPYTDQVIVDVDFKTNTLTVDWEKAYS